MLQVQSPFQQFFGLEGDPLDGGNIYIGTAGQNPETNPIAVFWDSAGTIPAEQPVKTSNGYVVRNGTPSRIYILAEDYSIVAKDKRGRIIFTALNVTALSNLQTQLQASDGSSLVGFIQVGTGSEPRTSQDKMRERVSIKDFGAVGDGITDDTEAIQAALDSLGSSGGEVIIPNNMTPLVEFSLNVPDNCSLVGSKAIRGRTFGAPNLNLYKPRIILNRSATIVLNNSSELKSIAVFAKNLAFSDTSSNVALWSGIAVTPADNKADMLVEDCMILGFLWAVSTGSNTRVDRLRVRRCFVDCVNGIYVKNAYDVCYISEIHGWPWTTLESAPEANEAQLKRPGAFIQLDGTVNDWVKVTDCFNYGWKVGYRLSAADSVTLLSCSADNPPGAADDSIGFLIEGVSFECRLIGCQAAGRQNGIYIATTDANGRVFIADTNVWASQENAVQVVNGDVNMVNCGIRNTGGVGSGVYFKDTASKLRLSQCKINGFSVGIKVDSAGAIVKHDGCDFNGTVTPVNTGYLQGVLANNPLVLDGINNFFRVVGTNNFNSINDAKQYAGQLVTLKFDGALVVAVGGNIKPAGGVDFTTSANDTVTFASDGASWYEVSRSIN